MLAPPVRAWRATLWILLSACCFGSLAPLTALATADGSTLQSVQLWRYATSALLLGVAAARARRKDPVRRARPAAWRRPGITLFGGAAQFGIAALSLSALRWLPAAAIGFLFYTYPAWVTIFSAIRRIDVVTRTRVIALLLALLGVAAMVGTPGAAMPMTGVLLALGAALVYAIYIPVMSVLQHDEQPVDVACAVALGGTGCFAVWSMLSGVTDILLPALPLMMGISMGVLTAVAFFAFLTGLASLGPVRTAILSTVEPIWTALLGLWLLQQPLGWGTVFGGSGILAAVVLLQRPVVNKS